MYDLLKDYLYEVENVSKPNKVTETGVNEKVLRLNTGNSVSVSDYYENNIHYKVFVNTRGGIDVVNMTKDSLEISKLK